MRRRKSDVLGFLVLMVCTSFAFTGASADPALVSTLDQCTVAWLSADPLPPEGFPDLVLIRGTGLGVVVNNDQGITQFHCGVDLDFSQPVLAINFFTGQPVEVTLGTFDDACNTLGFCRQGENGALVLDGTSGFTCDTALGATTDFQAVYTPSGKGRIVCRLPVRSEN